MSSGVHVSVCTVRGTIIDGSLVKRTVELDRTLPFGDSGEFGNHFSAVHEEIGIILGVIYINV